MMSISIWVLILFAGLATLYERACFSVLPASWRLPPGVQDLLKDAPVAVFAALAAPGLLEGVGTSTPSLSASRALATAVAGYTAWHTRSLVLTLIVGVVVYGLDLWVS